MINTLKCTTFRQMNIHNYQLFWGEQNEYIGIFRRPRTKWLCLKIGFPKTHLFIKTHCVHHYCKFAGKHPPTFRPKVTQPSGHCWEVIENIPVFSTDQVRILGRCFSVGDGNLPRYKPWHMNISLGFMDDVHHMVIPCKYGIIGIGFKWSSTIHMFPI